MTLPCSDLNVTASTVGAWLLSAVADDLCDTDVEITNDYVIANLDLCAPSTTLVTWTATDECGNFDIHTANLIIEGDEVVPFFTVAPTDLTLPCSDLNVTASTVGAWLLSAVADDLCDTDVEITNDYVIANLDLCAPSTTFCLLYTSPSPRDLSTSRMPSSA